MLQTNNFRFVIALLISLVAIKKASAQCPTVVPVLRNDTHYSATNSAYNIPCGSTTANLGVLTSSNQPGGSILTWHTGNPATAANRINQLANVSGATRKLYAAFYNSSLSCFSPTKEITLYAPICAANDDYSAMPIQQGTATTLPTLFANDTYNGTGFTMPNTNISFAYELWNTSYATVNADGSVNVLPTTPVGTYTFYYKILDADADAVSGSNGSIGEVTIVVVSPTLPVDFGNVSAALKNDALTVNWTTLSETNNSHFDVEVSANGKDFNKVGTVQTKADAGSNSTLHYTFSINAGTTGVLSLSLLGAFAFIGFRRKSYKLFMTALIVFAATGFYSCTKVGSETLERHSDVYVRIAQVDKDGKCSYSKVVKAIN